MILRVHPPQEQLEYPKSPVAEQILTRPARFRSTVSEAAPDEKVIEPSPAADSPLTACMENAPLPPLTPHPEIAAVTPEKLSWDTFLVGAVPELVMA